MHNFADASKRKAAGAPRSDSSLTFQSYDCSSRSSTLPDSRNIQAKLIDLEETGDEVRDLWLISCCCFFVCRRVCMFLVLL